MAKFTSYHLKGGQIFYAKTGAAVPEKFASKLTVDLAKGTVYKAGRKVGVLRQKTISKKSLATIQRNLKRRPRVPTTLKGGRGAAAGAGGGPSVGGPKIKLDKDTQSILNFNKAVDELVRMGRLSEADATVFKGAYKLGTDATRYVLWDQIHALYEEFGYDYKTVGWID
jgi:hypothetical protein